MTDTLPIPAPTTVSAAFWDATRRHELAMQRCDSCERLVWYPRFVCPHCGGTALTWERLSGNGTVYAVSVHHRAALPALADKVPYSVILVDLDEGARLMSNVFGPPPAVGDRVGVGWVALDDGRNMPVFEPK